MKKRELTHIPLAKLARWKDNPRGDVKPKDIEELVDSISANGVQIPLIVRKAEDRGKPSATGMYEVIAGNRRLAALQEVERRHGLEDSWPEKLANIPCFVERLDDEEAREIAILENMQRENLAPIQEAEAFADIIRRITKSHPKEDPIGWVAYKTGKTKRFIMERLVLLDLPDEGRKALRDGKMTLRAAIILARIPDATERKEAVEMAVDENNNDEVYSEDQAKALVADRFDLALSAAPWKWDDKFTDAPEEAARACVTCPHNTATQKELFADIQDKKPRCTNGPCFRLKQKIWGKRRLLAAEKDGTEIVVGEQGKNLCEGMHAGIGKWIPAGRTQYDDSKNRTAIEILKAAKVEFKPALATDAKGTVVEIVPKDEVEAALRKLNPSHRESKPDTSERDRRKKMEHFKRAAVDALTIARAKSTVMPGDLLAGVMAPWLVRRVCNSGQRNLAKAIGIQDVPTTNGFKDWEHAILAKMKSMPAVELAGMAGAAFLAYELADYENPDANAIMRLLGIDWAKCKAATTETAMKAVKVSEPKVKPSKLPPALRRLAKPAAGSRKGARKKK